jgi:isochorismate hydrolase
MVQNVCLNGHQHYYLRAQYAFTVFNYDFRVVVHSDCVASMYGEDLHTLGLQNIARRLGWVINNEPFRERITCAEPHMLMVALP